MTSTYSKYVAFVLLLTMSFSGCSVSYKFNGASIDYSKTHSISIADFPNNAELVNPNLANQFSEALRDQYRRQTRLTVLRQDGDMQLEGEITGYRIDNTAISATDNYAAETKLTISIKVRFKNNANPEDDYEKTYTAYQTFDSSQMLTAVQDELCNTMINEIVEQIYNDTVAKW
ncbi:MAG: LptE family protein [Paludibacteraceae bacterium]|nr:LptE family protein [Paludibacteraceae bacterium]